MKQDSGYDLLARYFGGPISGPTNADVAKHILLNSVQKQLGPTAVNTNEPSVMGRIFDILSRPNYAIADFAKSLVEGSPDPGAAIWEGLSGHHKTTFSDVLKAAGSQNNAGNAVLGLGLDVATDPLTYLGGAGLAKIIGKGQKAAEPLDKTLAQNLLSKGEPVHPESFGLAPKETGALPDAFKTPEQFSPMDLPQASHITVSPAVHDTAAVTNILDKLAQAHNETAAANILSDGQMLDFDKFLKKFGKASAKKYGVSPAAEKSTGELFDLAVASGKSPAEVAIEQNKKMLDNIISTGKQHSQAATVVTHALSKDLGKLPKFALSDNKAVEYLMGRVATWWGQRDLRPFSLNAIGAAGATAGARGKALHDLLSPFNLAQRHEAFRLAQGIGTASSPEVEQLATQLGRMMDNLSGRASSVMSRSAIDRKMLNAWMGRYGIKKDEFRFTNASKVPDHLGQVHDFSQGTSWLDSWKTAKIEGDPEEFLFKLQQSIEQATREKALYDELGQRFGMEVPGGGYKHKIEGHPYLDGYYFPEDIAKQIPRVVKDWSIDAWKPGNPLLKQYDRVLSMWKSGVTIYRPAHHIRNLIGDIYLGWMDGVNSLRPYQLALRVQKTMKDSYTDLLDVDKLVDLGLMQRSFRTPKPGEILFRNRSGVPFTAEQIGAVAHQKGLLEHTRTIEDIIDLGDSGRKGFLNMQPFGGKVQKFARGASELIGHNARLAHFIDKVQKSHGKDLAEIFEQAARRARKWHPTGLDLTDFEKKYLRRVIPFYSWLRKSTPLLAEGLAMNPGKIVGVSKAYDAMQTAAGIETPGRDNPFPVDEMFPQWIRAQGLGPIGMPDGLFGPLSNQQPPGYVLAGVGLNPLSDLMSQIEQPGRTVLSSLTPGVQVPLELLTGQKFFTGEPITGSQARPGAFSQYVGEQIPFWSALQGVLGITPTGEPTRKEVKSGGDASKEALINWLTAAGIKGTGPYTKQAYHERYQPMKDERANQKYEYLLKQKGLG